MSKLWHEVIQGGGPDQSTRDFREAAQVDDEQEHCHFKPADGKFAVTIPTPVETRMVYYRALLCLVIVAWLSLPAAAQMNPFRGSKGTPLKKDDLAALGDATTRLLERPRVTPGATETWNNPATGIAGTVTAGQPTTRKGLACRATSYVITGPGDEPSRKAALTWCKTTSGWKIG